MAVETREINVLAPFPRVFQPLLEQKARYKVFYGGRNGAKSWQFARALLIRGTKGGLRVLCTREVQASLKESVKQLLTDQIKLLGLESLYRVLESEIRGPDGTLFMFKGLSDPEALKSAESIDVAWIEEARGLTEASWKKLDPTMRKAGAEIWISFNPELETDFVYRNFVIGPPPPSSIVVKVTFRDNPWLDDAIKIQIAHLKATDYDDFLWVYEGFCRVALDGAVYARELRAAMTEGRICAVPIEHTKPVLTFWDLGRGDMTAIWFAQIVGFQYRVLGYYQNSGYAFDHYLAHLQEEKERRKWFYGTHWFPHDAEARLLGAQRTIKQQAEDAGHRVRIVPTFPGAIAQGINAARTIFPNCYFDEGETVHGINCLRGYAYDVDKDGSRSKNPRHDISSHGADAFRMMGMSLKEDVPKIRTAPKGRVSLPSSRTAWMGR